MKKMIFVAIFALSLFLPGQAFCQEYTSDQTDQEEIAITIYNNDLGLVKDRRAIELERGVIELKFMDVASRIMPQTVHIKSLAHSNSISVLEQNYEYDLINPQKLLDKYVGKDVKLFTYNSYTDEEREYDAELLSNNNGQIYKIGNEIHIGHRGRVVLPKIPENLIAKPTLVWLLENKHNINQKLEVMYLTQGIKWKADYVVVLDANDDKCDMSGWVTIDNKSGTSYNDAELKLIAGDVNRVQENVRRDKSDSVVFAMEAGSGGFEEKEFFEYHIYTLDRKSTIKDNQIKQISLLEGSNIDVDKQFIVDTEDYWFHSSYGNQKQKKKVGVYVLFKNDKENNLGMPLPKGTIRVFKKDHDKSLQFVGEDNIDHTPKGEEVKLKLGDAFDVICERKQTDYKKIASSVYETAWEISFRNHKKENVVIELNEHVNGDWEVLEKTHEYTKDTASTLKFMVAVPGNDKEVIVKYRVRTRY